MKKHYIKKLFATVAVLLCCITANAYDFKVDGICYNILSIEDLTVGVTNGTGYTGDIVIPSTVTYKSKTLAVTSIGDSAFSGCSGLTSVTIGNSVTSIGDSAFSGCSGLTSITIGNSVITIGESAFYSCDGLTSITIPNSVTTIEYGAFSGCSGLTSITIGNSVTSIRSYAFNGCTSLKDLRIEDGKSTLSLGYNYYAGTGLFYDSPLETLYLGRNLSYNAGYSPFYNKTKLASVTIGNSVTSIGDSAFSGCSGLTSITIGNSVTSIGSYAFNACSGITKISLMGTTPPAVGSNNFTNAHFINSTVYVPQGALEAYQTADVWKNFWDIQELGATDEPDTETKKCAMPVISYENGALTITSATEGANFITEIRNSDVAMHYDSRIELTVTYDISTYATLAGYENSDIAMATLCWIDEEGIASDLTRIESTPVIIKSYNGNILLDGAKAGTEIVVYDINGMNMGEAVADGNEVVINTSLSKNDIAIVHIGNKAVKIIMQ